MGATVAPEEVAMPYVFVEELGEDAWVGPPWVDFFDFANECLGLGCVEPILLGTGEYENRLIVRDEEGWIFTVGLDWDNGDSGSYWEPACGPEWWVDEESGCACGRCE
jgi:hypothetical protein